MGRRRDARAASDGQAAVEEEAMQATEVRRRAVAGAAVVGLRGISVKALAFVGNVVLARLLVPRDFGLVAFGTTLMVFVTLLADGGLGAALIRRADPPSRVELRALVALQLLITGGLAVVTALAAQPFGQAGQVTALMVASLPLTAFRTPGSILLQRQLDYKPLVAVELLEALAQYAWAIGTVAAGWGVWGLASAVIARSVAGTATMARVSPVGLLIPTLSLRHMRGLLAFGARYQAVGLVNVLRDEGLNVGTAAIAGVSTLGLWALASRVLQVVSPLFESLYRVSYPAMARLVSGGEDTRPTIEHAISLVAVATGALLTLLVGSGHALMPAVFGDKWREVSFILPWASLGLMLSGPVSVAAAGYLYAVGDASTVLRGIVLHTLAWFAVTFPLLLALGAPALGLGWTAAGVVEALVLGRAVARQAGARVASLLLVPTAVAVSASGAGWALTAPLPASLPTAVLGACAAEAVFLAGLWLVDRALLLDTVRVASRSVRAALGPLGRAPTPPAPPTPKP